MAELVLVTGITGYIASQCAREVAERGFRVRGTVRSLASAKTARVREVADGWRSASSGAAVELELVEADLCAASGWADALAGVTYVLHTASPFPAAAPADEDELIGPAVAGVRHVFAAAAASPSVVRIVLTSSAAAIGAGHAHPPGVVAEYDETVWSDTASASIGAYEKSKTLAERAAWTFMDVAAPAFDLVVLNPGFVVGPTLLNVATTSAAVATKLLTHAMPGVPDLSFPTVDVRDVAVAHAQAMVVADAGGHRFILVENEYSLADFAAALHAHFGPLGYNVPTRPLPYWLLWIVSWFDATIALILPRCGRHAHYSAARASAVLGITFRSALDGMVDFGTSLIANGIVAAAPGPTPAT